MGAQALGLSDRGLLREGMMADVVVLDPATIGSDATYLEACVRQRGIDAVLVNGTVVVAGGTQGPALPGRVLERQRPRRAGPT